MNAPHDWLETDIEANGIRLHYYRSGGDKPQLVLAHGYSDYGLCWLRVARALQADYDLILYDARGHGHSSAPERGYSYTDRAADLAGLIKALQLSQPAVLGHSMGAQSAALCAADYSQLVSRVILEDPPWMEPEEARRRGRVRDTAWLDHERAHILERKGHSLPDQIELERGMNADWVEEEVIQAAQARLLMSPINAETIADPPFYWREIASRIRCPTLLLTGDVGRGALVTPELAAEALRLLPPGSRVIQFASGHSIHRAIFPEFVTAIRAFMAAETIS
ncbi:MAG: alpha/beta fold hydrolase [Anaerolineae bacterium]